MGMVGTEISQNDPEDTDGLSPREWLSLCERAVLKELRRRGMGLHEHDDIVQEITLEILVDRRRETGRRIMRPSRAVWKIAVRAVSKAYRRAIRCKNVSLLQDPAVESDATVDNREYLAAILCRLSHRQRAIVAARLEGLTPEEIAAELGMTRQAVDTAWSRICHKVRELASQGLLTISHFPLSISHALRIWLLRLLTPALATAILLAGAGIIRRVLLQTGVSNPEVSTEQIANVLVTGKTVPQEILDRTAEEMEYPSSITAAQIQRWIEELEAVFPSDADE